MQRVAHAPVNTFASARTRVHRETGAHNTVHPRRVPSGEVAFPRPEAGRKTMLIDKQRNHRVKRSRRSAFNGQTHLIYSSSGALQKLPHLFGRHSSTRITRKVRDIVPKKFHSCDTTICFFSFLFSFFYNDGFTRRDCKRPAESRVYPGEKYALGFNCRRCDSPRVRMKYISTVNLNYSFNGFRHKILG